MKKFTPYKRIDRYAFDYARFKTLEDFEQYIRTVKKDNCPDYIVIDNILYTMEEYDNDGAYIDYHNMRTGNTIKVETENRYKYGYRDAKVELYENYGISRISFVYAD